MPKGDIKTGTRRRLLIGAPGAATFILATREQGRAKSSLAKYRKKQKARARAEALSAMVNDLAALDQPITTLQNLADTFRENVGGGADLAADLQAIVDDLRLTRADLGRKLAVARGEPAPA